MEIHEISQVNDALAEMVALFRVELRSYKGILSKPNLQAGREEMEEYLSAGFPVFAAAVNGEYTGYMVCRVEDGVVWVESLFVKEKIPPPGSGRRSAQQGRGIGRPVRRGHRLQLRSPQQPPYD